MIKNDLTGKRFNLLVAIEPKDVVSGGRKWLCECDCGNTAIVLATKLKQSHTKSCGCYQKKRASESNKTHGLSETRTYHIWEGMRQRAFYRNSSKQQYYNHVNMDLSWSSYETFLKDMGECPDGHTIDRIDNHGDYNKQNCKWSTRKEQANNKCSNRKMLYHGKEYNMTALAELFEIDPRLVWSRVNRGWSIDRAIEDNKRCFAKKS